MNLKQKHAKLIADMKAIADGATAAERALTADEVTKLKGMQTELTQVAAELKTAEEGEALLKSINGLGGDTGVVEDPAPSGKRAAKSLGDHVIAELGPRLKGGRSRQGLRESATEYKAAADTQVTGGNTGTFGGVLTTIDTQIVEAPRRVLTIEDLLGSEEVSGTAVTYFVEGAMEGSVGNVGENAKKPQLHFADPTPVTETLAKIAAYIKESDELLEDLPWLASSINGRLLYQLGLHVEDQLLNGSGTGGNLRGLLNRTGIQVEVSAAKADNADAIFRASTKVQTGSGFSADALVINPLDYQQLRLSKDANGQYFGGGMFAGQYGNGSIIENPSVWGLRTVVTPAIAQGTALVGAYRQAASVLKKGGVRVDITNSNEDDFIHNRITELAERRVGLAARRPAAFTKITFSDVTE